MPASFDFYVPVIDNFGDMGFALNLARSIISRHPGTRIRFFSEDRSLFDRMMVDVADDSMEYLPLSVLEAPDAPAPARCIFNFFDRKLPRGYLDNFPYPKTILHFGYFLLYEWVESLHGTRYLLENGHDTVVHVIPSLLRETGGIIINPEIERRKQDLWTTVDAKRKFLDSVGVVLPDDYFEKKWISVFTYPETLNDVIETLGKYSGEHVFFILWSDLRSGGKSGSIIHMPFLPLEDYGVFQSFCDANIVRGENSLCQGLISGRPVLWDIYKEKNAAHMEKIEDFLVFLRPYFEQEVFENYARLFRGFNTGDAETFLTFMQFLGMYDGLRPGFEKISGYVRAECNLVKKLEELFS